MMLFSLSCTPRTKSNLKKLQENDMNFPDLERINFEDISFLIPDFFENSGSERNTISEFSQTFTSYDLNLEFTAELFSQSSIDILKYTSDNYKDNLPTVHENHILIRKNSLNEFTTSIKKKIPAKIGRDGLIQVIHGNTYMEGEDTSYFIATLEIDGESYVFQLIGKRENMGYLYDDFITILASIEE